MIGVQASRRLKFASSVQKSETATIAAPLGGWNDRDPVEGMDPLDAVILRNWWPGTNNVILRSGYTQWATGLGAQVQSLMAYSSGTANKLFAAAGTSVYNVTSSRAVGAADITTLGNAKWQYVNFTTSAGSYLCMVNGSAVYRVYDGTNWHKDGDGAPYDITGVTSSNLINITVFKTRIWFCEVGTLKAW